MSSGSPSEGRPGPGDELPAGVQELLSLVGTSAEQGRFTQEEIERDSAMGTDARQFWRALGFPDAPAGVRVFGDSDVEMLRLLEGLLALGVVDRGAALQMARVIGSSMARIASAQVDTIAARLHDEQPDEAASAAVLGAVASAMPHILEYSWRRHLQAAARRRFVGEGDGTGQRRAAVGFADLVGFTAMSQLLSDQELSAVVERFDVLAYDTVARLGGRVVKTIGDEVMFTVQDAGRAVDIALSLAEAFHDEESLSDVRVGVAIGPVLEREGDIYGATVNLASRIVNIAFAASVVVSDEVHDELEGVESLAWKHLRTRYLKDIGRVRLWVVRRSADPFERESVRERARRQRAAVRDRLGELVDRPSRSGDSEEE